MRERGSPKKLDTEKESVPFYHDDHLAQLLDSIRVHGKGGHKYDNEHIGINGRLDTI